MKNSTKLVIYLLLMISLGACGKSTSAPTATIPAEVAAIQTDTVATVRAQITQTAARSPTPTPTPDAYLTRLAKFTPPALALKTLEPTQLPAMLQNAISVKTDESFEGHRLRRITGWQYGFTTFDWMDENHLLIRPVVAAYQTGPTAFRFVGRPVVMRLNKNTIWFPLYSNSMIEIPDYHGSHFQRWSVSSRFLIVSEAKASGDSIYAYSPDGDLLKTYEGRLIGISPSGSKILLAVGDSFDQVNGTKAKWIDLLNNKEVIFDWKYLSHVYGQPVWSSDEMKVYMPYGSNYYGNAKTGESYMVSYKPFEEENAEHLIKAPYHSYGKWQLNDTYVLAGWNEHDEGIPGFISFFDSTKKAYRNLSALAGFPYIHDVFGAMPDPPIPCDNGQPIATPGGRYVWINCQDGGRLIDMKTFKAKTYPDYSEANLEWSADGNFAFLRNSSYEGPNPPPQILSAAANLLTPMTENALCSAWHPKKNVFVYMDNKKSLSIFDARSLSVGGTIALPTNFDCPVWDHRGNKLIMMAEDESLWQIAYPALSRLEQLTKPIKGLENFALSPDDTLIAFSADPDLYIVDTKQKP